MNDRICLRCKEVFCTGEVTQPEGQALFRTHLVEKHSWVLSKVKKKAVAAPEKRKLKVDSKAQRKTAKIERVKARRSSISPSGPPTHGSGTRDESSFVSDLEWDAPIRGNVAFHQSPRKVGSDGVPIYEKSQYGQGVLDLLLKNPHKLRKLRPHLSSWVSVPLSGQFPMRPSPELVNALPTSVEPGSLEVSTEPVEKSIEKQAKPPRPSRVAPQLSLTLMRRLRELHTMSGRPKVFQGCNHVELLEAQEICRSLLSRLAEQAVREKA